MGRRKKQLTQEQMENRRRFFEVLKDVGHNAVETVKANPTIGSAAAILGLWEASTRGWVHPTPCTWAATLLTVDELARHTEGEIANTLLAGVGVGGVVAGGIQAMQQAPKGEAFDFSPGTSAVVTTWETTGQATETIGKEVEPATSAFETVGRVALLPYETLWGWITGDSARPFQKKQQYSKT